MNTILISYDLGGPESSTSYIKIGEKIQLLSNGSWAKVLETFRLIKTFLSAEATRDTIKPLLDKNDKLITINITGDAAAWTGLSEEVSRRIIDNV